MLGLGRRQGNRSPAFDVAFYSPWIGPLLVPDAGRPAGGAETQILLVAQALRARGLRVAIIADEVAGSTLPAEFGGVSIFTQSRPQSLGWRGQATRRASAFTTLWSVDAAVYVQRAAGTITGLVAVLAAVRRRPFLFSTANVIDLNWRHSAPNVFAYLTYRLGLRLARRLIVQTDEQALLCRHHLGREGMVIRSIAEPATRARGPREMFLWIGRPEPRKAPEVFVALARAVPEARFVMVGAPEGPAVPNLERLPPMPRHEVLQLLDRAVAVVSTSGSYEGMPNVFLEGWARGVPALAFAHDPDELIARYGLGACANGSMAVFADHARHAWSERERSDDVATRCRDFVAANHAPSAIAAHWEAALGTQPPDDPRILQVLTCDGIGGTELMVCMAAAESNSRGHLAIEVAILGRPGPIADRLDALGVRRYSLGGRGPAAAILRLARLLRRERYDVVHAYGFKGPFAVRFLARLCAPDTMVVSGIQGLHPAELEEIEGFKSQFVFALEKLTSRLVDVYEANSRGAVELLAQNGIPRSKLRYLPNGIDTKAWIGPELPDRAGRPPTILSISRFIPRKRQADLVRAVGILRGRGVDCRLLLAGGGPTHDEVRQLVRQEGLDSAVALVGLVAPPQVPDLLRRADVFCQPSLWEGMPATVMEAMAAGLPVVGTQVNGISDLVLPGHTGWLVPPCRPDVLADALGEALSDPARCVRMGSAGRARLEREFSVGRMVTAKEELYRALVTGGTPLGG